MLNMTLEIIYKMVKPVSPFENLSLFGEDLNNSTSNNGIIQITDLL